MASLGLAGGYGAGGATDELKEILKERIAAQMREEELKQREFENQRRVEEFGRRQGLDERQQGHTETVYADGADQRGATLDGTRATTEGTQATTAGRRLQNTEAERIAGLRPILEAELSGLPTQPGRMSPLGTVRLKDAMDFDATTAGADAALYGPGTSARTAWTQGGGQDTFREQTGIQADAQTRVVNARQAASGGTGGSGDPGSIGLAEMAARNPSTIQSLTPTEKGRVMRVIASNPELRQQWEQTRMEPVRERSKTIMSSIEQLVEGIAPTDGGGLTGRLTSGGRAVFGEFTPVGLRGFIPGQEATDANAALEQVIGQNMIDLIGDMKAQSQTGATGFGAMNEKELAVIESAATKLTSRLSEGAGLQELLTLYGTLQKTLQDGSATGAAGPAAGTRRMIRGVEAEWDGQGWRAVAGAQ